VIDASLRAMGAHLLAGGRLRRLRKAARIFGFHLATVDLRQNSEVHERVIDELLREAGVVADYASLPEAERQRILCAELGSQRLLRTRFGGYSDETRGELAIFETAAAIRQRLGPDSVRQYIISKTDNVSDLLEAAVLLKEAGLVRPGIPPSSSLQVVAAFRNHRRPAPRAADHATLVRPARSARHGGFAWRHAGGDARLFRQQQGRRLRHVQLGALQGLRGLGRDIPRGWGAPSLLPRARRYRGDAAGVRATRRSWRNRRAACRASCGSPSRAKSSRASTPIATSAAAISKRCSRQPCALRAPPAPPRATTNSTP
jgi:hypothetical protein